MFLTRLQNIVSQFISIKFVVLNFFFLNIIFFKRLTQSRGINIEKQQRYHVIFYCLFYTSFEFLSRRHWKNAQFSNSNNITLACLSRPFELPDTSLRTEETRLRSSNYSSIENQSNMKNYFVRFRIKTVYEYICKQIILVLGFIQGLSLTRALGYRICTGR